MAIRRTLSLELAFAAGIVAFGTPTDVAHAAEELASVFVPRDQTNEDAKLELYHAACGDEPENVECIVAALVCGRDGPLGLEMTGFSDEELGKWLLLNGGTATLKSGTNALPMQPFSMEVNELNGWSITFQPSGDAAAWLRSAGTSPTTVVATIEGDMVLPTTPKDVAAMKEFLSACTAN